MNELVHKCIEGDTAVKIAGSIERGLRGGLLPAGARLPTVRRLAAHLGTSPATVASAFRLLRDRGIVVADGRRGTRISPRPGLTTRTVAPIPDATHRLDDGNPDPALLPSLATALAAIDPTPCLYGGPAEDPDLMRLMRREFKRNGVAPGTMCVVSGAMDGIERILADHFRPGDRIAVEDPGFTGILDMVASRGLTLLPMRIDDEGPDPEALAQVCRDGAQAIIVTPRAQSPMGAAVTETRARDLRAVLRKWPDVMTIEDDHANLVSGVPIHVLHDAGRARWAYVHSFSKPLCPDLRVAVMTGDAATIGRVHDRIVVGERWVSHVLQRLVASILSDKTARSVLRRASTTYALRRTALIEALHDRGIPAVGRSGYNVWVPVREETATVQALAADGWAVAAGERFRLSSPPAVRVTASTLDPSLAPDIAAAFAAATRPPQRQSSLA